ncbi:MAG TPA: tetratricopeptide repeat protein, partial [Kofleriaceae bacterium]|nr:tetratricopeptide repeat protein [Kofleriaceae bacterium]
PARFGNMDLPTPKHDAPDLLTPVNNPDLPAPKGFFDDLPQPARSGGGGLPAPKGFFDDLPQVAKNRPEPPAPKGFFDDLPQNARNRPEPPAPKGFFDDLPQPARAHRESQGQNIDLGDLEPPGGDLDLGLPEPNARASYEKLDLDGPPPVVRIQPNNGMPNGAAPARAPLPPEVPAAIISSKHNDLALELEDDPRRPPAKTVKPAKPASSYKRAAFKPKSRSKLLLVTLVILAVGGGGFYGYQRHVKAVDRANAIDDSLKQARDSLVAPTAGHWRKAQAAAQQVITDDPENRDALSLGAEAHLAGALDTGTDGSLDAGKRLLGAAVAAGASPAQLARPQGLAAIVSGQAEHGVEKLKPLAAAAPKDGFPALYLGWAQAAANDLPGAIKSFDVAVASSATKLSALYARGRAKLASGDLDGARADFTAVYEAQKDHIGAQVGLAAAAPASRAAQRETDLLAILARKDIKSADPRAISQAWTLAADEARRAGRLDTARERYRKALAAVDKDVAAMTGLAEVELRDNKVDAAGDLATKALSQSASYVPALLVMGEIEIRTRRFDDA